MNNSNRGNNRRRGRGNSNRPQGGGGGSGGGGGGGQQLNRIDSRARGNAPQMLEKFRKLASDAHLNGDRVQAEYYLQFADHYFRVIADTRLRQEEQRARRDDRWQEGDAPERDGGDDNSEFGTESDFPAFDQQPAYVSRREREGREREERPERTPERPQERQPSREPREDRFERIDRDEPSRDEPSRDDDADIARAVSSDEPSGNDDAEVAPSFEPAENPFVRGDRSTRGLRPRREDRRPRRDDTLREDGDDAEPAGLDPSMLPPAISATRDETIEEDRPVEAEAKPRRARRPRPPSDDALEAVSQD